MEINEPENRCSSVVMKSNKRLRLPSIFPTRQSVSQSQERKVLYTCSKTSIAHNPTKNVSREFSFDTKNQKFFDEFTRENSLSSSHILVTVSSLDHIRES